MPPEVPRELGGDLLVPMTTPYDMAAVARRMGDLYQLYQACEADPAKARAVTAIGLSSLWNFLCLFGWTTDQKDLLQPIKPFPPLEYNHTIATFIDARDERGRYLNPKWLELKSRQMQATWMLVLDFLYTGIDRYGSISGLVSSKLKAGQWLLDRMIDSYVQLPPFFKRLNRLPEDPARIFRSEDVTFPKSTGVVRILPEAGGHNLRSGAWTKVRFDEAGFQDSFEKSWQAAMGGQVLSVGAITTATPGYFTDVKNDRSGGRRGGKLRDIHEGQFLQIWQNTINRVAVIKLHYKADPGKRSDEWRNSEMAGFEPWQWRQEMEMDEKARGGQPVFPYLERDVHMLRERPQIWVDGRQPLLTLPPTIEGGAYRQTPCVLGLGIDHGQRNQAAGVWWACTKSGIWVQYREYHRVAPVAGEHAMAIRGMMSDEEYRLIPHEYQVIDALMTLADQYDRQVHDLYRYEGGDPSARPIMPWLQPCTKGPGSKDAGLNQLGGMLLTALAIHKPNHWYWKEEDIKPATVEAYAKRGTAMYFSPACEQTFTQFEGLRFKDGPRPDENQPEEAVKADDHSVDATRYLRAAGFSYRR
jgi:hypothetical protein